MRNIKLTTVMVYISQESWVRESHNNSFNYDCNGLASLGPGSASEIGFQSAWRQEGNNRYGLQSGIFAIISGSKRVAAKSIRHMPSQPVNSDVGQQVIRCISQVIGLPY